LRGQVWAGEGRQARDTLTQQKVGTIRWARWASLRGRGSNTEMPYLQRIGWKADFGWGREARLGQAPALFVHSSAAAS